MLKRPSGSWAETPEGQRVVGSPHTGDRMSCRPEKPMQTLREEVFQLISRKMGLFSVNSATVQKQSSSSLGRNSMGLFGSRCCGMQKVRSHSGSLSSPSASRKNHLKYPLKNSAPPQAPSKYEKEEIASVWGTVLQWGWPISLPSPRDLRFLFI